MMRKASEIKSSREGAAKFPYADPTVTFIYIESGMNTLDVHEIQTIEDKIRAVKQARETSGSKNTVLLAVWPGKFRSDAFMIDDFTAADRALRMA